MVYFKLIIFNILKVYLRTKSNKKITLESEICQFKFLPETEARN